MTELRRLEVIGPFRGASGYDRHTREFVREFVRAGLELQLTPLAGWSHDLPEAWREPEFEALLRPVAADTVLHFTMPNQARPRPGKVNINFTMFEADRIPRAWVDAAAEHQRIVVPCRTSFDAWVRRGVPARQLRRCPLGVDSEFFGTPVPPLPVHDRDGRPVARFRHRFLNVADLRPRKNHLGLLRVWLQATRRDDDAVLMLKLIGDAAALAGLRADLAEVELGLGRPMDQAAPVVVIAETFADDTLRALYRSATHYVSLSHGEGWDLPMLEAAAAGLAPIAPRHSAYLDTLRDDEALWIPSTLVPARFEGSAAPADQALFDGAFWWQPDEAVAVATLREVLDGRAAVGVSPGERLRREGSWARAAQRLLEVLNEARTEALA